jgi:hypothetical protein
MQTALRRAILLAVFVTSTSGVARAQTVCDQLFPFGLVPPEGGFGFGCAHQYNLRLGRGSGSDGNYWPLEYPACANGPCAGLTGPLLFVCAATSGYSCCISASQLVPLVAGNYSGPLRSGLAQRIANDTDTRAGICYSDYTGNDSRLGNVPLIQPIGNGDPNAHVAGFLRMFLSGPPPAGSDQIPVEFVDEVTPVRSASWGWTKILYR